MDKSRGDAISKIVVIGQTLWFIIQCIARAIEGLPITNLEIMTLAFAMLNFITYFMWWSKPQGVHYPIKIDISERGYGLHKQQLNLDSEKLEEHMIKRENQAESFEESVIQEIVGLMAARENKGTQGAKRRNHGLITTGLAAVGHASASDWEAVCNAFDSIPPPIRAATYLLLTIINQSVDLTFGRAHYEAGISFKDIPKRLWVAFFSLFVLFGGIHCIPWSFAFPTHTEQILWRVCAILVTSFPFLLWIFREMDEKSASGSLANTIVRLLEVITLPVLYIIARFTLIVLGFMELRTLAPGAYQIVEWTMLIPHI
ncbi:hypothetical protein VKT23_012376 [Stygiomarasmius scandens]|uniref:PIN-like protein n=1 Tax=Marasmiellus scandens TaxID=2682957 RepID=A0ABR1J9Y7_9AGAR